MHKRRVAYELDVHEQILEENQTMDEYKQSVKENLDREIQKDLALRGQKIDVEILDSVLLKSEEEVKFGLKLKQWHVQDVSLIEFNIEKAFTVN